MPVTYFGFNHHSRARLKLWGGKFNVRERGKPQGWVISPLAFDIAMPKLLGELNAFFGLSFAIYIDNITQDQQEVNRKQVELPRRKL